MRFDDRLSTVLRKPVTGEAIARILFRQLLDLLGTMPNEARGEQVDAAYLKLAELARQIPASERAAMLEGPMLRLRNPRLVAQLAEAEPAVATAAVIAARLGEEEWLDLIPALPIQARGVVRHRRDLGPEVEALLERLGIADRALPAAAVTEAAPQSAPAPAPASAPAPIVSIVPDPAPRPQPEAQPEPIAEPAALQIDGIGAIVRRIEQFRKTRQQTDTPAANDAPRLPLGDTPEDAPGRQLATFDFATDAEARIVWSIPAAAPMVVGLRLGAPGPDSPVSAGPGLAAAFRHRQPVRGAILAIEGAPAVSGAWQADAAPRFDQPGGRFIGYCGRMRRLSADVPPVPTPSPVESEADRMRQILHELRTPVNAIQGFAQVIEQQLFGPTPHEYRALAYDIVSDSARLLAGFDELDRLVKLDTGALDIERGESDLAAIVAMTVAQLEPFTARRSSGFLLDHTEAPLPVTIAAHEAERLVWRLLATLAGAASPGEVLRVKLRPAREGPVRLTVRLPQSLAESQAAAPGRGPFQATAGAPAQQALSSGMFGSGFALRLAAAEARAAGGELEHREAKLRLSLPAAAPAVQPAPAQTPAIDLPDGDPEADALARALDATLKFRGNT